MDLGNILDTPPTLTTDSAPVIVELDQDEPRAARVKKKRKPLDADRRALEADAEAVRRELRKALRNRDADALAELRSAASGKRHTQHATDDAPSESTGPVALAPRENTTDAATVAPTDAATRPAPGDVDPRGPAWPAPSKVASMRPLIEQLCGLMAVALDGTRWAISGTVDSVDAEGKACQVPKTHYLAEGLTPVAAKYLPSEVNTPEALAAVTVFAVFGAPAIDLAMSRLQAMKAAGTPQVGSVSAAA